LTQPVAANAVSLEGFMRLKLMLFVFLSQTPAAVSRIFVQLSDNWL